MIIAIIVEKQNRIIHDHREPFWTNWNFSKFLKSYKMSPYYAITGSLPQKLKISHPPQIKECSILETNVMEDRLWMSYGNTSSSLHFDTHDNMLHQIHGIKEIFLWNPEITPFTYMDFHTRYGLSPINTDKVDKIRFAEFSKHQPYFVVLFPGDMLYLPTLWWHQLRSPLGRNIMYTQEFKVKVNKVNIKPVITQSKSEALLHAWKHTLTNLPTNCNPTDFKNKKIDLRNEKFEVQHENTIESATCYDFCNNPCEKLNGNFEVECKNCSSKYKCNPLTF